MRSDLIFLSYIV